MTHFEIPCSHHARYLRRELSQSQIVGHRRATLTYGVSNFLVRHVEFFDQPLQCACLFNRVQILALDVLDQRESETRFVRDLANNGRDLSQARLLGSAPAPLARSGRVQLAPLARGPAKQPNNLTT